MLCRPKLSPYAAIIPAAWLAFATPSLAQSPAVPCSSLATPGLFKDTTVTLAVNVAANPATGVPAYCRVVATIQPMPDSKIGVEYRLPDSWNGKFLGIGGGGLGGAISNGGFTNGLTRGYAAAQTDIGHTNADGVGWALIAPGVPHTDRITDYSWRAVRLMTTVGKEVVNLYYAQGPQYSYWQGCSLGGRQGMMETQRFPEDYDGVIAGDPVYTHWLMFASIWRANQFQAQPETALTLDLLPVINDPVLDACDAKDGLQDGILDDPRRCAWDPHKLVCASGSDCLSSAQADAIASIYRGPVIQGEKRPFYPGVPRGSELGWESRYIEDASNSVGTQVGRYIIHQDATWDKFTHNINDPAARVLWANSQIMVEGNASDPDISAFVRRGGKMIMYHGFYDPGPSPYSTIEYYDQLEDVLGKNKELRALNPGNPAERVRESVRLFMVPGMYHCSGGPGTDSFDTLTALEQWVEQGIAPDSIHAVNEESGISRPLCPYPQVARYIGSGDPNDAANFRCVAGIGKGAGHGKGQ